LSLACALPIADAERLLTGEVPAARGASAALKWLALCSLSRRRAHPSPATTRPALTTAARAAALLQAELVHAEVEELHVLALDSRNRLLRRVMVARGGVNRVCVTAREVFRPLVASGASRAIVAHNHPSGFAAPSDDDRRLTVQLSVAGALLGVPLVDHLVIARDGYYSFAEREREILACE
jgi:DNA repair protein RadC